MAVALCAPKCYSDGRGAAVNKFLGKLEFVPAEGRRGFFELTAMLAFESERAQITVVAMPGFITNFVTGRKLLVVRRIVTDSMNAAAVIHDQLYDKGSSIGVSREMADAIFRDAMLASDVTAWRAWAAWAAVRTFGGQFYARVTVE